MEALQDALRAAANTPTMDLSATGTGIYVNEEGKIMKEYLDPFTVGKSFACIRG